MITLRLDQLEDLCSLIPSHREDDAMDVLRSAGVTLDDQVALRHLFAAQDLPYEDEMGAP